MCIDVNKILLATHYNFSCILKIAIRYIYTNIYSRTRYIPTSTLRVIDAATVDAGTSLERASRLLIFRGIWLQTVVWLVALLESDHD